MTETERLRNEGAHRALAQTRACSWGGAEHAFIGAVWQMACQPEASLPSWYISPIVI